MIIFAKICISNDYREFILLFVQPAENSLKAHSIEMDGADCR